MLVVWCGWGEVRACTSRCVLDLYDPIISPPFVLYHFLHYFQVLHTYFLRWNFHVIEIRNVFENKADAKPGGIEKM